MTSSATFVAQAEIMKSTEKIIVIFFIKILFVNLVLNLFFVRSLDYSPVYWQQR
tara:strand:- start:1511 stop:1672 length:162 start_codon:yes stop_codon:yes gene_type:complete